MAATRDTTQSAPAAAAAPTPMAPITPADTARTNTTPDTSAGALERDSVAPAPTAPTSAATAPTAPTPIAAAPDTMAPTTPAPSATTLTKSATSATSAASAAPMRIEVDRAARKLYVYAGDRRTATYPVAVGSTQWPTQPGEWKIKQVIFNPAWIPPDETWAEESVPKDPGAPDNPLGRAQLVYDPPRTIHGTDQPSSIGKAVSHGSIRMSNATITALAEHVMAAAGADKGDAWVKDALAHRHDKRVVDLPNPIPIRIY